jgi:hypothetical protein
MRVLRWGTYVVGRLEGRDRIGICCIPTTPWDSGMGDLRSSTERYPTHHGLPTEATQYMSKYLMHAQGSETGSMFHEGVWPPPGEGATLVDPILRSSSQVDLTGIMDSVMGRHSHS